jgi:hypothetical protein
MLPSSGNYHAWPMKWVKDSEAVASGAYDGIQFGRSLIPNAYSMHSKFRSGGNNAIFDSCTVSSESDIGWPISLIVFCLVIWHILPLENL